MDEEELEQLAFAEETIRRLAEPGANGEEWSLDTKILILANTIRTLVSDAIPDSQA